MLLSKFCLFCSLGLHLWHVEVPRLGVKLELHLPAYATATAVWDLSCVCDLYYSSGSARSLAYWVRPRIKPAYLWNSWVSNPLSHNRNSLKFLNPANPFLICEIKLTHWIKLWGFYNVMSSKSLVPASDFINCLCSYFYFLISFDKSYETRSSRHGAVVNESN